MNAREKKLAIAVLALGGLFLAIYGYGFLMDPFVDRANQIVALQEQIAEKEKQAADGDAAKKLLTQLQDRSLPSNPTLARQLYQSWLLSLVNKAKFEGARVSDISTAQTSNRGGRGPQPAYQAFTFKITGSSDRSLAQLVQFMHGFYSAGHLHRINQFVIRPRDDGKHVDLELQVQALMLTGAKHKDRLSTAQIELPPAIAEVEKTIVGRNLFAEYVPPAPRRDPPRIAQEPPPRRDPPRPSFDVAKHARLTAIVEQNNEPQVWIRVMTSGDLLMLREGDEFTVGGVKCQVLEIGEDEAIVATDGKRLLVTLGDNLREAAEVPSEGL